MIRTTSQRVWRGNERLSQESRADHRGKKTRVIHLGGFVRGHPCTRALKTNVMQNCGHSQASKQSPITTWSSTRPFRFSVNVCVCVCFLFLRTRKSERKENRLWWDSRWRRWHQGQKEAPQRDAPTLSLPCCSSSKEKKKRKVSWCCFFFFFVFVGDQFLLMIKRMRGSMVLRVPTIVSTVATKMMIRDLRMRTRALRPIHVPSSEKKQATEADPINSQNSFSFRSSVTVWRRRRRKGSWKTNYLELEKCKKSLWPTSWPWSRT